MQQAYKDSASGCCSLCLWIFRRRFWENPFIVSSGWGIPSPPISRPAEICFMTTYHLLYVVRPSICLVQGSSMNITYMIVNWNECHVNEGGPMEYICGWSCGQYPMFNEFWFHLGHSGFHSGGDSFAKMFDIVRGRHCSQRVLRCWYTGLWSCWCWCWAHWLLYTHHMRPKAVVAGQLQGEGGFPPHKALGHIDSFFCTVHVCRERCGFWYSK